MGIEYYAFALFITGLICMIAILCKLLFADVRRQRKLLDEKETKLLRLFQTVEEVMEGFNDQVEEAREEIKKHQNTLAAREAALRAAAIPEKNDPPVRYETPAQIEAPVRREVPRAYIPPAEYPAAAALKQEPPKSAAVEIFKPRPVEVTPARTEPHASGGVSIKPFEPPVQQGGGVTFQRMIDELVDDPVTGQIPQSVKNGRNAAILNLKEDGKTVAQIARELGITQNEVKLVIGLNQ